MHEPRGAARARSPGPLGMATVRLEPAKGGAMTEQRKGGPQGEREERERKPPEGAAREAKDPREDEGWSQPESSAQKQREGSPPEQIPEEG